MARLILVLLALMLGACEPRPTGAAAERGRTLIAQVGCGACHRIPGVRGANGQVGPPLDGIGRRTIIAGVMPNTPARMTAWLIAPQSLAPGGAMPDMGLGERDAADIAAYLETLR